MTDVGDGYSGTLARYYDANDALQEREDLAYYRDLATASDGPVLELACGTGRVYLDLLRSGVDADGFDASADALSILRETADREGLDASVWQADMTDFSVGRSYDLAICPFNAIQHARSIEDQLSLLESVHDALAPGGRFVFDVFVPSFETICEQYGEWEIATVEYHGEPHDLRTRSRIVDEPAQLFAVDNEIHERSGEVLFSETFRLKMLPKREVELLARASPFAEWSVTGDFADEPLADGHSIQVWSLGRATE